MAVDDLDNDGDVDLVVLASRERPMILRNMYMESRPRHHWLQIQLVGVTSNRDAVGSRVTVSVGDMTLTDEVHSGRSYQSHSGSRLQFGLGPHNQVDQIEIRWNGGASGCDPQRRCGSARDDYRAHQQCCPSRNALKERSCQLHVPAMLSPRSPRRDRAWFFP